MVDLISKNIDFFDGIDLNIIRELYHRASIGFYDTGEKLFDIHDICDTVFVILSGSINIVISDGTNIKGTMDILGPGSIIGINTFLKGEQWWYYGINNINIACKVLKIDWRLLDIISNKCE